MQALDVHFEKRCISFSSLDIGFYNRWKRALPAPDGDGDEDGKGGLARAAGSGCGVLGGRGGC